MGQRLLAVVAESEGGRIYLSPTPEQEAAAAAVVSADTPDAELPERALGFRVQEYGMTRWRDLFTARQLNLMGTFSGLVADVHARVRADAAHTTAERARQDDYADAVALYLALVASKLATFHCTLGRWKPQENKNAPAFGRHAIPMVWDFPEMNPFAGAGGDFGGVVEGASQVAENSPATPKGTVLQMDARQSMLENVVISCDPPYYDNIGYADLSDFFYVWLRRAVLPIHPDWAPTIATPKADELIATPFRHGGSRDAARRFFETGLASCFSVFQKVQHPAYPLSIYYAFKQTEDTEDETAERSDSVSTGWETLLSSLVSTGFSVVGTWPLRTEKKGRLIEIETNALSSSILLVCRSRAADAPTATRREFVAALKGELPQALRHLQHGNIAPVDLAQAAIGPGMAVFTRFAGVLDAEGNALSVRQALALINQTLDEVLAEQEGDFDVDSRWALAWFDQYGFGEGPYGVAETLSKAKNTTVAGMVEAGILASRAGKVRLLAPYELPTGWDPDEDRRIDAWEMLHHLIRVFEHAGEASAAQLLAKYGSKADVVRELAYRLYTACERRKRAKEAGSYNALVQSWPEIARLAKEGPAPATLRQGTGLFDQE